ncbi:MAG: MFS transporter [Chloroflexota bacterium]
MGTPHWRRTLSVLVLGQGLTSLGFSFPFPFMPLYLQELGVADLGTAAIWAGVLMAAQGISIGAMGPVWGRLADQRGRKPMLVRSFLGAGFFVTMMGFARSPLDLLFLRFVQGAFSGTISSASALAVAVAPSDRRGHVLGMIQLSVWLGGSLGPPLGALTAGLLGYRTCFWIAGTLMLAAGVASLVVAHEPPREPRETQRPRGAARADMRRALPVLLAVCFAEIAFQAQNPILPLFAAAAIVPGENPAPLTGWLFGAAAVAGAVGSATLGRWSDRLGYRRTLICTAAACGALFVAHALTHEPALMLVLRATTGFVFGGLMASMNALLATRAGSASLGLAYGFGEVARSGGRILGPVGAATLAAWLGLGAGFLYAAAALFVVVLVTLAMRTDPWPDELQDAPR